MKLITRSKSVNRFVKLLLINALIVFFAFFAFKVILTHAQQFGIPPGAAPDNAELNSILMMSDDFVSLSRSGQTINSSLIVNTTSDYGAILGDYPNNSSLTAFAGGAPPWLFSLPGGSAGAAVYAYGVGGSASAGVYGFADGTSAPVSVAGRALTASGYAGRFYGRAEIVNDGSVLGTLTVDNVTSAPRLESVSSVAETPAFTSAQGIEILGGLTNGLRGRSSGAAGLAGSSNTSYGFYAVNDVVSGAASQNYFGIVGVTNDQTNYAGVYGYSRWGNGVVGEVGGASVNGAVVGESTSANGAAVYGRGGAFAGYFEGDVVITNGSKAFFIGDKGIDEALLIKLLQWCGTAACHGLSSCCPDFYQ